MQVPFSVDEFLGVFRAYNLAIWPSQVALYLLGALLVYLALRDFGRWHRWGITVGLAFLWAWMGSAYHIAFFARINPAAYLFGGLFFVQAALLIIWSWRAGSLSFQPTRGPRLVVGAGLLTYSFVVYPVLNFVLGHGYPAMPTFGLPCPTTIATFGFLAWATPRPPWFVWVIPLLWAVVGTSAAFTLEIPEDFGLFVAATLAIVVHVYDKGQHSSGLPSVSS